MVNRRKLSMKGPRIVIIGGGAGGLELATRLGNKLGRKGKANVTLVDCNHTHIWKPLLHEVATGTLDIEIDQLSYRAHAAAHGFEFQLGRFIDLNRQQQTVILAPVFADDGEEVLAARELNYDYLVLVVCQTISIRPAWPNTVSSSIVRHRLSAFTAIYWMPT
jgi:NADH:ubiquinone reductase (H+-translocating)